MEGQAELGLFFLLRKRNGFFDIVVKDGSSPGVSCVCYYKKSSSLFISYKFLILPHNIRITITLP